MLKDEFVQWEDPAQTVIRVDFSPHTDRTVTAQERLAPILHAFHLAGTVSHEVNLLLDLSAPVTIRATNWLTQFRHLNEICPENLRRIIVIGTTRASLYERVLDTLRLFQTVRVEVRFVASLEEAQAMLEVGRGSAGTRR